MELWRQKLIEAVSDLQAMWNDGAGERERLQADVERWKEHGLGPIKDAALRAALERVGLEIEEGQPVNELTITQAINAGPLAGTDIEFSNVFDRHALRAALERVAIKKIAETMGVEASTVEGLKAAIVDSMTPLIAEQLANEAGEIFENAPPSAAISRIISAAVKNENWNTPIDFSDKGVSNRARQAKYRANHTRHWEERWTVEIVGL